MKKEITVVKIIAVAVGSFVGAGALSAQNTLAQDTVVQYPAPQPLYEYVFPEGAGLYINAQVGPTFFQDGQLKTFGGPASGTVKYDVGVSAGFGFGYAFNQYLSAGIELGFVGTTIDSIPGYTLHDADFYNVPFMANVTFACPIPHTIVTPYIGAGVGGSDAIFDPHYMSDGYDYVRGSENDVVFAWEAYAGLNFQLAPNVTLGIGYKYLGTGNPTFSYPPSPKFDVGFEGIESHSIMASLTVKFW